MLFESPPAMIAVLDTSAIVNIKLLVRLDDQYELFERMKIMVQNGLIAYPSQVRRELQRVQHPDAPGVWGVHSWSHVRHPQPSEQTLVLVSSIVGESMVDPNATNDQEDADPYVAAMAYEITQEHPSSEVFVATDDDVDRRPTKISLATGLDRLGIERRSCPEYLEWVRTAGQR